MPTAAAAAAWSLHPSPAHPTRTDDSMAILAAFNSPEVEILGLTSIYGNVPTTMATRNALTLCHLAGRPDVSLEEGSVMPGRPLSVHSAAARRIGRAAAFSCGVARPNTGAAVLQPSSSMPSPPPPHTHTPGARRCPSWRAPTRACVGSPRSALPTLCTAPTALATRGPSWQRWVHRACQSRGLAHHPACAPCFGSRQLLPRWQG